MRFNRKESEMIHTVITKQEHEVLCDLASTYSDLFKDLYGMRPRGFYPSTIEEYKKEINKISEELHMEIIIEEGKKERIKNRKPYISKLINNPFKDFYERNR
jgi:predicted metalloendopeptidase